MIIATEDLLLTCADRRGVMMIESECRSFFSSRDEVNCVPVCFRTHIETKTCVNCGLEYHSYVVDDEGKAVFVTVKTPEGVLIDELGVRYSAIPRGEE